MIPRATTLVLIQHELEGASAWAERKNVPLVWVDEKLELRATLTQPETGERFYLSGLFDDYKELPPCWYFASESWAREGVAGLWPRPTGTPPGGSSIFIVHNAGPVICAPFNRLAFALHKGPHADWGDGTQWITAAHGRVHATTVGDMLQVVHAHLQRTRGRL